MIRLSRLTDYAVTLLSQMVGAKEGLWAASELAEKSNLTLSTTSKILKILTKSGVVSAQRGSTGGYRLNRSPSSLTVAAIVEAMDGPIALTDCVEGSAQNCKVETICPMSGRWDKINRAVRRALEEVSLADMAIPRAKNLSPDNHPSPTSNVHRLRAE